LIRASFICEKSIRQGALCVKGILITKGEEPRRRVRARGQQLHIHKDKTAQSPRRLMTESKIKKGRIMMILPFQVIIQTSDILLSTFPRYNHSGY